MMDPLLFSLALILLLASPALGLLAAAVATWQAQLAGSVLYMPLGLVLVLALIAVIQSHKPLDVLLFGSLVLGTIGWFIADAHQQAHISGIVLDLSTRVNFMPGLIVASLLTAALLFTTLRIRKVKTPPHRD